ncbi:MAG: squalene synthase HpnC [Planctomycetota bacterium]|nr:MAG: squalene synthase HpnC [Planctomycetota bacterium]
MAQLSATADLSTLGPGARPASRAEAAEYCHRLARRHYENFTVVSLLLPRRLVPHMEAIYAYCRWADDLADEVTSPEESLELLDWWQAELERCYAGEASHPVFVALRETIREFEIPREPFVNLLEAFRQDQRVTRYASADDVLAYCRDSANPVGRLVLYLGRCHDDQRAELSDAVCTGLQLVNFCQDVARDWHQGRVYLPQETLLRAGYDEAMFARGEYNDAFVQALREEVDRAERFLRAGEPLVSRMPRELRLDVALFVAGGLEIVRAIRKLDYDVWRTRPTLSKHARLRLLVGSWWRTR